MLSIGNIKLENHFFMEKIIKKTKEITVLKRNVEILKGAKFLKI
jgi:hypothetical protein